MLWRIYKLNGVYTDVGSNFNTHDMKWIIDNKEWIFSGIGVFILGLVLALFKNHKTKRNIKMKQKSGSNSTNIQIGGDYNGK